jgi:tetratricopeptide (TPR) repeat protein
MTSTSNLNASATGRLESLPMCELLAYALYRKLSGSFVFETLEHDRSTLVVAQGRVSKVSTARAVLALGEVLIARGALDQPTLGRALGAASAARARLGDALVEQERLTRAELESALHEQLARRVAWVGALPRSTSFVFYGGVDLLAEHAPLESDPLRVIARSLHEAPPAERIVHVMMRVRGQCLRLSAGAAPGRLELAREQASFADALQQATDGLVLEPEVSPALRQLVYLLVLTRQLQLAPVKEQAHARPSTGHASGMLRTQAERPSAAAPRSTPLPPSPLSQREAGPLSRPAPSSASAAFRAAQECVKRHQLDRAQALAEQACRLDGAQVESQALLAWIQAQRDDLRNARLAQSILSSLNQAIRKEPNNPRIRFYRGQVLKRLGRTEDALRDFRFSARQDPENLDAIRELRVHNMRSEPPPARTSGVFARFFGRS